MSDTTTHPNGTRTSLELAQDADTKAAARLATAEKAEQRAARTLRSAAEAYKQAKTEHDTAVAELDAAETAKRKTRNALRAQEGSVG